MIRRETVLIWLLYLLAAFGLAAIFPVWWIAWPLGGVLGLLVGPYRLVREHICDESCRPRVWTEDQL